MVVFPYLRVRYDLPFMAVHILMDSQKVNNKDRFFTKAKAEIMFFQLVTEFPDSAFYRSCGFLGIPRFQSPKYFMDGSPARPASWAGRVTPPGRNRPPPKIFRIF
jgi:hypothetical protein